MAGEAGTLRVGKFKSKDGGEGLGVLHNNMCLQCGGFGHRAKYFPIQDGCEHRIRVLRILLRKGPESATEACSWRSKAKLLWTDAQEIHMEHPQ